MEKIRNYPFMNGLRSIRGLFKKSREKIKGPRKIGGEIRNFLRDDMQPSLSVFLKQRSEQGGGLLPASLVF